MPSSPSWWKSRMRLKNLKQTCTGRTWLEIRKDFLKVSFIRLGQNGLKIYEIYTGIGEIKNEFYVNIRVWIKYNFSFLPALLQHPLRSLLDCLNYLTVYDKLLYSQYIPTSHHSCSFNAYVTELQQKKYNLHFAFHQS